MSMHEKQRTNYGFVILCPSHNVGLLRSTLSSIHMFYPQASVLAVTGDDAAAAAVEEMSQVCRVIRGGPSLAALVKSGLENGHPEWNLLIHEGSTVPEGTVKKLFAFAVTPEDVLYPLQVSIDVAGRREITHVFSDISLNGLLLHRGAFDKAGGPPDAPMKYSMLLWGLELLSHGIEFKAVAGVKIV